MPKGHPKPITEGKRVNVWIPPAQLPMAIQIENLSKFVQIALDNAPDIMAWAILRDVKPEKYHPLHSIDEPDLLDNFNKKYPLDPLTKKRQRTWHKNFQQLPDVLL